MKKALILFVSAILALSLAGCATYSNDTGEAPAQSPVADDRLM